MSASKRHRQIIVPWNKGKLVGQKLPLKLQEVWAIRVRLEPARCVRDLALFNLAIDSKLRSCDLVKLSVRDSGMTGVCLPADSGITGVICLTSGFRPEQTSSIMFWDKLPWMAVYRGHMADRLTGTSNGGATVHSFGYKVIGPNSYGTDDGREILSLSGYPGSISREAANLGHPTGLVNDGDIAGEPGTGAFFAETATRGEPEFQSLQLLGGRPGFNGYAGNPEQDI